MILFYNAFTQCKTQAPATLFRGKPGIENFSNIAFRNAFARICHVDQYLCGGIFYMYVSNWWHSVAGGKAIGHFPFAPQRMEMPDYERYVREALPKNAEAYTLHWRPY